MLLGLLLALSVGGTAQGRIVAISDVHGAYPQFVGMLQRTGLVDPRRQWIGAPAILLQLGDVPSRGHQTRKCLDLLMDLERQALKQQGRVIPLLGNHEVMAIIGDLRYVQPDDFRTFVANQSKRVRTRAYAEYRTFLAARKNRRQAAGADSSPARQKWMEDHALGFFEYRDAFAPKGVYGSCLRKHDTVAQVGDMLFLHGGLSPQRRFRRIQEVNERIRSELARFDSIWQSLSGKGIIWRYMTLEEAVREVQDELAARRSLAPTDDTDTIQDMQELLSLHRWLMVSPDGPLWYRGYAWEPEEELARWLEKMMSRLKVRHVVAAHTIRESRRIILRLDNRIFLVDTGMMLDGKGDRASALEIQDGRFTAYYSNREQQVLLRREGAGTVPALGRGGGKGG